MSSERYYSRVRRFEFTSNNWIYFISYTDGVTPNSHRLFYPMHIRSFALTLKFWTIYSILFFFFDAASHNQSQYNEVFNTSSNRDHVLALIPLLNAVMSKQRQPFGLVVLHRGRELRQLKARGIMWFLSVGPHDAWLVSFSHVMWDRVESKHHTSNGLQSHRL